MLGLSASAKAWEFDTHARLTYVAYTQSAFLKDSTPLKSLGIELNLLTNQFSDKDNPFGRIYYGAGNAD
jgi:hypothetical protein